MWGENLTNLALAGSGTISGNGKLTTGNSVSAGQGDKILSLALCTNVTISGVTLTRGGHFAILANGISNMLVSGIQILDSTDRDGFNLISSSCVVVTNCVIQGSDDAMVLKSDYALGQKINSQNIHIVNCQILSTENNATQFGSETVGDFRDVTWAHLQISGAGKAGLGLTSNDGSVIDGVTYNDITMSNCACPIFLKLSNQGRAPGPPPVGRIQNISFNNVVATHSTLFNRTNTSTIDGYFDGSTTIIPIGNITFNNVNVSTIGGNPAYLATNVPPQNNNWTPDSMGVRPSFGWYLRYAKAISFTNCQVHFDSNDDRPAVVLDTVTNVLFDTLTADVGEASPYDLRVTNSLNFEFTNSASTLGAALRLVANNAMAALIASPPVFSPGSGIFSATQSVAIASASAGAIIHYTTDGTTPTSSSGSIYSGPVSIGSETVLKAIASAPGLADSAVNTAIYNYPGTSLVVPPPPPVPPQTNFAWEAESLPYSTNGAVAVLQNDSNSSGGHWLAFEATAPGQYIDYTLPLVPAGSYDLQMSYKGNTQRGILTLTLDGVTLGTPLDQYSSTQTYPTQDYGNVTFATNASHVIRLTAMGKNSAATGYWLSTDRFILNLVSPPQPVLTAVSILSGNAIQIACVGYPTLPFTVEACTNLASPTWQRIGSSTADTNGAFLFTDNTAANFPSRFYRIAFP